jgi:hypothetical protein
MNLRQAAQRALKAMEDGEDRADMIEFSEALIALHAALAEPEQEPVAWMYQDKSTHEVKFQKHMRGFVDHGATYETPLYTAPTPRKPLRESDARMMASLMDEAAANLAALMETPQADALGVRHFLPDELNGCAIMLRKAYGIKGDA